MPEPPVLTRWHHVQGPTSEATEARMRSEGLQPVQWTNGPNETYTAHEHTYHKVLYCVEGSVAFVLVTGERLELGPGDRLDLPAGWPHAAIVGPGGVTCLEAQRKD